MRVDRLRFAFRSMAAASLLAGISGCSSSAKPAAASVATEAAEQPGGAEAEIAVDLTPVAAPENLVALSTIRAPAQSIDTVMAWTGLGVDWRALAQTGAASLFLPILDLDAPVDAVATLDPKSKNKPKVYFAASLGLRSRQGALDAFRGMDMPVDTVEPGVYSVRPNPNTLCFIAPALGKAKVRLVCGENKESLDLLMPYLTRGNPSQAGGDAAFHLELRAEPAWRLYGDKAQLLKLSIPMLLGEVSIGNAEFDAALRELLTSGVEEVSALLADLKDVRVDAHLKDNPAQMTLSFGMSLRGSTSWVAGALGSAEGRASAAPDSFWKLPLDASQATYQSKGNPESFETALGLLERLGQSGLSQLGGSAAVQKDWPHALHQALSVPGPAVSAQGEVPARLLSATPDAREQLRARAGYLVIGTEDEGNQYGAFLERTLKAYEDTALRKGLSQRYGVKTDKLPKVTSKKGPTRLPESKVYEINLPASAFAKIYSAAEGKNAPPLPSGNIPLVLMTCREGSRTWLAFSSYAALAEERLAGVLAAGPETTLARRTGLDSLRSERANLAGFWTVNGLKQGLQREQVKKALSALGGSDVPMIGRANGHAQGPTGDFQLNVPAQVFKDLSAPYLAKP
jgi:hypothetical protein